MLRREENTNQSHQVPVLFSPLPLSSVVKGAKDNSDLSVPLWVYYFQFPEVTYTERMVSGQDETVLL